MVSHYSVSATHSAGGHQWWRQLTSRAGVCVFIQRRWWRSMCFLQNFKFPCTIECFVWWFCECVADILTFEFFFLRWISLFVRKTLSQYSALTSGSDVGGRHFCPLGPTLEPLLNHKFLSMQPNYRCKQVFCMAISDWVEMSKSPTNSWFNMHG